MDDRVDLTRPSLSQSPPLLTGVDHTPIDKNSFSREVSPRTVLPTAQQSTTPEHAIDEDNIDKQSITSPGDQAKDHLSQHSEHSPLLRALSTAEEQQHPTEADEIQMNLQQPPNLPEVDLIEISDDDEDDANVTAVQRDRATVKQEPDIDFDAFDLNLMDNDPLFPMDAGEPFAEHVQYSIENDDNSNNSALHVSAQTETDIANMLEEFNKNHNIPSSEADAPPEDEVDSEEDDAKRRKEFAKLKKAYLQREKANRNEMKDIIEFKKAEKAEIRRRARRKGKRAYAEEEASMFFPEREASSSSDEEPSDDEIEVRGNTPSLDVGARKRGYAEVSAANDSDGDGSLSDDQSGGQPPKRGSGSRGRTRGRGKVSGGKSATVSAASTTVRGKTTRGRGRGRGRATGRGGRGGKKVPEQTLFESLLPYDMFGQANKNREAEPQPTFTTKNKQHALAELIASIPLEQRDLHIGDKKTLDNYAKIFNGHGAMKADGNGKWKLKGMETSLHHYQTIGAGKMREREHEGKPYGGLLSDEMGLGKTVMAIANIVDGRAPPTANHKTTLIITPAALQQQWCNEIKKHVDPKTAYIKDMLIYKSSAFGNQDHRHILSGQDVVITSYHEVVKSYPKKVFPPNLITARAKEEYWEKYFEDNKGPLHQIKWHRIVLDEAQAIKNHHSRTSEGVWKLRGKYRWTLSGTPVVNSLEEFFAYFRFLKVFAVGDFELWKKNFCKKGSEDALKRLKAMLEKMMIRRTHKDQLFGRPIIQLPPVKAVKTIELEFSAFERALYKIVRDRFVTRIKSWKVDANATNNYANIFILLLRLRQLTAHMLLIQKTLKDLLQIEDLEKLWSLTTDPEFQADDMSREQAAALQQGLGSVTDTDASACASSEGRHGDTSGGEPSSTSVTHGQTSDDQEYSGPSGSTSTELVVASNSKEVTPRFTGDISAQFRRCLKAMRDDGQWEKANARSLCPYCGNPPEDPYVTSCLHIYCFSCLNELAYAGLTQGEAFGTCLDCSCKFKKAEIYAAQAFQDAAKGTPLNTASRQNSAVRGRKGSKDRHEEDVDWFKLAGPIIQSTKTIAAVKQIEEWWEQDRKNGVPPCKILLFSQFRGVLRVFEKICDENLAKEKARKLKEYEDKHGRRPASEEELDLHWGHAQFHGEMSFESRNKAIDKFSTKDSCKILLAAMKAGGVGLNLTAANRVILIDLWWNVAMETQAYCRVFRIGQERDVEVVRFAVKNTVDMDILNMQDRKTKEIDSAMEKKNRLGGLTTDELLRLFGPLEDQMGEDEDEDGGRGGGTGSRTRRRKAATPENEPFIMPNDPYLEPDSDQDEDVEGEMIVEDLTGA